MTQKTNQDFFWHWRRCNSKQKKALCEKVGYSYKHLCQVANDRRPVHPSLKTSLSVHFNVDEAILFPLVNNSQGEKKPDFTLGGLRV